MGLEWVAGASASQNAIVSFILEPEIRSETISLVMCPNPRYK